MKLSKLRFSRYEIQKSILVEVNVPIGSRSARLHDVSQTDLAYLGFKAMCDV